MHRAARRCPRSDSIIHAGGVGPVAQRALPTGRLLATCFYAESRRAAARAAHYRNVISRGGAEPRRCGTLLPQRGSTRSRGATAARSDVSRNVVPRGGAENYPTGKPRVAGQSCPVRDPCTSAQFHSIHDFKAFDVAEPSSVRWREMLAEQPVAVAVAVPAPPRLRVETRCDSGQPEQRLSAAPRATTSRSEPARRQSSYTAVSSRSATASAADTQGGAVRVPACAESRSL